ncbi:heavy-metal-associated domain-containing protein [Massilia antarctica]|uniref:Heavy-metal-associated domain-containing protein n=1 Tax=Massilia antarctica TaxID=2765360 RepID=A0AA48W9W2_9BURK|nr:heavy metal-associated domain-containing protein [Massilia antarctica]QPI48671.1 heavy-metal-associated domain-containing protein [Massilia antarctica]
MKKTIAIALLVAASSSHAAPTLKAEVNGMVCAFCAQGIEKHLRQLPQTKDVYVNLKERIVAVEIKDGETLAPDTVKTVVKDAGYDVIGIETVSQTASQLKAAAAK